MSVAGGAADGAFKVNSLTGLDRASAVEGRVDWDAPALAVERRDARRRARPRAADLHLERVPGVPG